MAASTLTQIDLPLGLEEPTVRILKLFLVTHFFLAFTDKSSQEVTYNNQTFEIGGFHPFPRPDVPNPKPLHVNHGRALLVLVYLAKLANDAGQRTFSFSMYEFAKLYANSNGGKYNRHLQRILGDLTDTWIRITDKETGVITTVRLLEKIEICQTPVRRRDASEAVNGQMNLKIQSCTFSVWFYEMMTCLEEVMHLKLKVFTSIRSPIAQSTYMYIPSRAVGRSENNPWKIGLAKLLDQVGCTTIPTARSKRIQLFTQNGDNSVIKQLDFKPISRGVLRVRLVIPEEKEADAYLEFWQEKEKTNVRPINLNSKIFRAWTQSGGTEVEYRDRIKNQRNITDDYELDLLKSIRVAMPANMVFQMQIRALIGPYAYRTCLAETAANMKEPGFTIKTSPASLLGARLMEAVKLAASKFANSAPKSIS